jgi:Ca2+-binding EF-hand superfamily protein
MRTASLAAALLVLSAGAAAALVAFPRADQNRDGYVTYEEAVRVFPRLQQIQFRKCDPDGDGLISKREYPLLDQFYWTTYEGR